MVFEFHDILLKSNNEQGNNTAYFYDNVFNNLWKYDAHENNMNCIYNCKSDCLDSSQYTQIKHYKNSIILCPCHKKDFMIYNLESATAEDLLFDDEVIDEDALCEAVKLADDTLFFISNSTKKLYALNLINREISVIENNTFNYKGDNRFFYCWPTDDKSYFVIDDRKTIMVFDYNSKSVDFFKVDIKELIFDLCVIDNEFFLTLDSGEIVKWDTKRGIIWRHKIKNNTGSTEYRIGIIEDKLVAFSYNVKDNWIYIYRDNMNIEYKSSIFEQKGISIEDSQYISTKLHSKEYFIQMSNGCFIKGFPDGKVYIDTIDIPLSRIENLSDILCDSMIIPEEKLPLKEFIEDYIEI